MIPNVPSRLNGTDTLGISVERTSRRNTNTTRITSRIEITGVRVTSFTDARIVVVRSSATLSFIAGGTAACSVGRIFSTLSTVSITFAVDVLKTTTRIAGVPLNDPPVW